MKYATKKVILAVLNALAVLGFMMSITLLYSNSNFKIGITNLNSEVYEDSPVFVNQFAQDTQHAFDYIETRDIFETNGKFDVNKKIFSLNDGPMGDTEYTVADVISTARKRGYYLDENYQILSAPNIVSSEEDDARYTLNWSLLSEEIEIDEPADVFVNIDDLIKDVLQKLAKYYAAYNRLIDNPCNFSFLIVYDNEEFTNNPALSDMNVTQYGRWAICQDESLEIQTNLPNVPTNLGYLLENSQYNLGTQTPKVAYLTVDTTYPHDDVYYRDAISYANEREEYFKELLIASVSAIVIAVTLVLLVVLAVKNKDHYDELSIFNGYKRSFEGRILVCALAIIVLLYLNEKVFKRLLHMYLPFDSWEFAERVTGYGCIYASVIVTAFSILESGLAGNLWSNSFTKNLFDKLDKYIDENSFSKRSSIWFISIVIGEVAVTVLVVLLFVNEKSLTQRFIAIGVAALFVIANIALYIWFMKKSQQYDKLSFAVNEIAKGKTSYQLNEEEFDGKEGKVAKNLNSLGTGLDRAITDRVKSERMKADLITNVSHDIKTPLTSIINYVDLIKRENPTDPKIVEYLEVLDQKSQHLKHLTEDLVEASKVSSGNVNLQMQDIDFVELVQQANGEFEEKFATRGLSIVSEFPDDALIIKADGASLWRVLENLYNNAFKYAAENSRVYVNMSRGEDGKAEFTMKNMSANPLNISPDELTERFVRGDVSRTTEGSGLGLSIAGSLTKLQGGTFSIQIDGDLFKAIVRI